MYQDKTILALIPARGGSKGLPRKNIRNLNGKPLIAWSITAALDCNFLDKIIISTEDEEIATEAAKFGAEVPFLRPHDLATDAAKSIDVILHAINWFEEKGKYFDLILLLQPTSPLRTKEDIVRAFDLLSTKNAAAIVSVCECEHSPLWMNILPPDLCMKNYLNKDYLNKNRQDLTKYYRLNGAIYIANISYLKKNHSFWGDNTYAYIMPNERSIDIDSELDLKFAEYMLLTN